MKKLSIKEIVLEEQLHFAKLVLGSPKERFVKITFLIATEGTKTEPNYLKALKKELEATNRFNIDISIEGKGKATKALVNKLIRQVENCNQEYDRVWAVFDKDDFSDFDEAINLAKSKHINCAWSNESFELWLLLHFRYISAPTKRNELFKQLEQAIRDTIHKNNPDALFDLSKGNDKIYELVTKLGSESDAIKRASVLKTRYNATKASDQNPLHANGFANWRIKASRNDSSEIEFSSSMRDCLLTGVRMLLYGMPRRGKARLVYWKVSRFQERLKKFLWL